MDMKPGPLQSAAFTLAIALLIAAGATPAAQGVDRIERRNGTDSGEITAVTPLSVTISKGGVESKVPVEEIRSIRFSGEPAKLSSARKMVAEGRYGQAIDALDKIDVDDLKDANLKQELEFLQTVSTARLALAGNENLKQASASAAKFLANNRTSYHLTEALEIAGDLLLAAEKHDEARKQYAKLAKAPSPYFKSRSAILIGRSMQDQSQHEDAITEFDKAIELAAELPVVASLRTEASLGRAVSQATTGHVEESTSAVKAIISQAGEDDEQLLAQAYNILGDCYLRSDDARSARDAFLHVDLLFTDVAQQHAKALYELSQIWNTLGHKQRAQDARQRLQEKYPKSPWTKR
jgi:tetratricopeptide (TPR) repeat protein